MLIEDLIIQAAKKFGDYNEDGSDADDIYDRVKLADWVEYYNAAQRALLTARPEAHYKTASWALEMGQSRQAVPSDCFQLIEIDRNMGSDGLTRGAIIRQVSKAELEDFDSTWHSEDGDEEVEFYSYELDNPDNFWVYPRTHSTTSVYVNGSYSYAFTDAVITTIDSVSIEAADRYITPLQFWMLKEAWEIDTDSAYSLQLSQKNEQSFYQYLGVEFKAKMAIIREKAS